MGLKRELHRCVAALAITGLCVAAPLRAATNDLTSLLQQGLFEEEANRNLDAAIANYQSLAAQFDQNRQIAATAIFRLGECYRKLGRTNDAVGQYERIIREFSDQNTLATLSRQNLTGMGISTAVTASPPSSNRARQEQRSLLENQIQLSEQDWAEARKRFELGVAPQTEARAAEREVLRLRQELAALDSGREDLLMPLVPGADAAAAAEAEAASLKAQLEGLANLPRAKLRIAVQQNFPNPMLTRLSQDLADAEQKRVVLEKSYTQDHPEMVSARKLIATIDAQINTELENVLMGLQIKADMAAETAKNLRAKAGGSGTSSASAGAESVTTDEEEQEIRRIKSMIQNSPDLINAPDKDGWTPLQRAAVAGQLRVAQYLLDTHANMEAKNPYGDTALNLAATAGHKAVVELLLNRGAAVNAHGNYDYTALHHAAQKSFNAVAEVLLAHKADVNASAKGRTPLHMAAENGSVSLVKLLLANGADVNAKGNGGPTPLHSAAASGQTAILPLLLAAKADLNARNGFGETPLLFAVRNNRREAAEMLLAAGADPRLASTNGFTNVSPLHYAVANGDEVLTRELLERGADPNLSASHRPTSVESAGSVSWGGSGPPLFTAWEKNNPALVTVLLEHGADPNARYDDSRKTPLLLNAWYRLKILKLLLEHKADPNLADTEGRTALHSIAESDGGLTNAIALLVEHGANVNARLINGSTPLYVAVNNNHRETAAALLAFKADPNLRNDQGMTPLDLAKGSGSSGFPGGMRMIPPRIPGMPSPSSSSGGVNMASLLLQHGALDNLPHLDRIELSRPGIQSDVPFQKGTSDWNRFTLLEVIAENYGLIGTQPMGEATPVSGNADAIWPGDALRFPDFKAVVIHRPSADGKTWRNIPVNVAEILSAGDCSRDVLLQWGDVVEIPEADHPVSEKWSGLTQPELQALMQCVSRTVTIAINNTNATVKLAPVFVTAPPTSTMGFYGRLLSSSEIGRRSVSFMVRSVLDQSKLIRFSSDLSRVKVNRRDPASGRTQSWVVDCSGGNNVSDLWLRNGDVIEVPEK